MKEDLQKQLEELNKLRIQLESQLYSVHVKMTAIAELLKEEKAKEKTKKGS